MLALIVRHDQPVEVLRSVPDRLKAAIARLGPQTDFPRYRAPSAIDRRGTSHDIADALCIVRRRHSEGRSIVHPRCVFGEAPIGDWEPCSEALVARTLFGSLDGWSIEVHRETLDRYFAERSTPSGLHAPKLLDAAMCLALAERYRQARRIDDDCFWDPSRLPQTADMGRQRVIVTWSTAFIAVQR